VGFEPFARIGNTQLTDSTKRQKRQKLSKRQSEVHGRYTRRHPRQPFTLAVTQAGTGTTTNCATRAQTVNAASTEIVERHAKLSSRRTATRSAVKENAMGNTYLSDLQKLIMWGESLNRRLRTNLGTLKPDELDRVALKPDELECLDFMLGPPFDVQAPQQIGFLILVRDLFSDMKIAEIGNADRALRRIAGIKFLPAANQLMTIRSGQVVLSAQTMKDYQGDFARVIRELKSVRDTLLRGSERRQKAQSVGRPHKAQNDQAYELKNQKMADPELARRFPDRIQRLKYIIENIVVPQFPDCTPKSLKEAIRARDRNKGALRKKSRKAKEE
jgi:hypothetical protein